MLWEGQCETKDVLFPPNKIHAYNLQKLQQSRKKEKKKSNQMLNRQQQQSQYKNKMLNEIKQILVSEEKLHEEKKKQEDKSNIAQQKVKEQKKKGTPKQKSKNNKSKQKLTKIEKEQSIKHFIKMQQQAIAKKEKCKTETMIKMEKYYSSLEPFRVKNKVTIALNHKNKLLPIHQRAKLICLQKKNKIIAHLLQKKKKKDEEEESCPDSLDKFGKEQEQNRLKCRERLLRHQQTTYKLITPNIKKRSEEQKQLRAKPEISPKSRRMFANQVKKGNLSPNVYQRLNQYNILIQEQSGRPQFLRVDRVKSTRNHTRFTRSASVRLIHPRPFY